MKTQNKIVFLLFSCLLLSFMFSGELTAQVDRKDFVFHVYVDPIYGDDQFAADTLNFNPAGGWAITPRQALQTHPSGSPTHSGLLQHAPYSFKTVTAALNYINNNYWWISMPWIYPASPYYRINAFVIHCMPGLYAQGNAIDPKTGLRANGETFPIRIPENVGIQGTSALDTIFDAQYENTHIFGFYQGISMEGHEFSFIDSVTIRGCRSEEDINFSDGAGILIWNESTIHCTISNCFITDNIIGIAICNDGDTSMGQQRPKIINNTIALNQVGIWSGNPNAYWIGGPGQPAVGLALPLCINNILDSGDPYARFGAQINNTNTSPFLGLHPSDLLVSAPLPGPYNAFEMNRAVANDTPVQQFNIPGWTWTSRRNPGLMTPFQVKVDIAPYTHAGQPGTLRGVLYIRDIFFGIYNIDHSPHDFRLAPHGGFSPDALDIPNVNPLVNKGIASNVGMITMSNSNSNIINANYDPNNPIGLPPGLPLPPHWSDVATYYCWDWDTEGFGNPRIATRPYFIPMDPTSPLNPSDIDLGADEMGDLIMAGYLNDTRIFTDSVPNAPQATNHTIICFVDVVQTLPTTTYPRPNFNFIVGACLTGQNYSWWDWSQKNVGINPPAAFPNSNYTVGNFGSFRESLVLGGLGFNPFMRNLQCDFSPHLLREYHPIWANFFTNAGGAGFNPDIFSYNPWFNNTPVFSYDNQYAYYDPAAPRLVEDGHINPPLTYLNIPPNGHLYPWGGFPPFPIFTFAPGSPTTYSVGSTALSFVDTAPSTLSLGARVNCQVNAGTGVQPLSNLQTFLLVVQ